MNICIVWLVILMLTFQVQSFAADNQWKEYKGKNFIISAHDVPEDFVNTVMEEAEADFERVTQNMGITRYESWAWNKRARIFIYRDQEDYVKNGGQAGWSHGSASIESKVIRTFPSASGFFDSILPHELGHIILHELIGLYTPIPLWFEEGVAMYQEKARQLGAHAEVKKAIKNGQFIPLSQLMLMRLYNDTPQETVQLFYMESASIVNFMITEFGAQHFYKFCCEIRDHKRFEDAISKAYIQIRDLEDLNKRWVKYLEEK